jgi:hypothetical protein
VNSLKSAIGQACQNGKFKHNQHLGEDDREG